MKRRTFLTNLIGTAAIPFLPSAPKPASPKGGVLQPRVLGTIGEAGPECVVSKEQFIPLRIRHRILEEGQWYDVGLSSGDIKKAVVDPVVDEINKGTFDEPLSAKSSKV